MESNILSQKNEQVAVSVFYEGISNVLKQCDDCEEKEKIKEILHHMNDTVSYVVLGEEGVGKTTLLRALFQNILDSDKSNFRTEMEADICEYRYGEQEFTTQPVNGYQKKFIVSENLKGISIIDTKGLNHFTKESLEKIKAITSNCEAVFVVLDAKRISSPALWDVIEEFPKKNMIFFLAKCDLLSESELIANREKVKCYMKEADISAPVFSVTVREEVERAEITPLDEVCTYIRNQVIGVNPIISRQWKSIEETRILLAQMQESFLLRQRQHQSDTQILSRINQGMDAYVANQEKIIRDLIGAVTEEINQDIEAYQNEIISKIDSHKIKERFQNQQDFTDYLHMVNDNYKNIMNDSVNRKTINAIKNSLHDLEIVFDNAVGFFDERESILTLNDKFYGSLSVGRKNMIEETKENALLVSRYYRTLSDASETLFLQIWEERKKYDKKIAIERALSGISGGAIGATGGYALAKGLLGAVGFFTMGGYAALISIGVIVGAAVINSMARTLFESRAEDRLEEASRKCIEQFKAEVSHTRTALIEQMSVQITDIFKREIAEVDGYFAELRMSVNIDERNLPLLETKLTEIGDLLETIDAYKKEEEKWTKENRK